MVPRALVAARAGSPGAAAESEGRAGPVVPRGDGVPRRPRSS